VPISETGTARLRAALNRAAAVRLRLQGWKLREIADHIGVSKSRAHQYLVEAIAAARREAAEDGQALLELELAHVNELLAALLPRALAGGLQAAESLFAQQAKRDRLLAIGRPDAADDNDDEPPAAAAAS
jgi:hypothetical protein